MGRSAFPPENLLFVFLPFSMKITVIYWVNLEDFIFKLMKIYISITKYPLHLRPLFMALRKLPGVEPIALAAVAIEPKS